MKKFFKYLQTDKILKLSFQLSAALLLGQLIYIAFFLFSLPPLIPLFNQLPWGEQRLGQWFEIFLPSGIVLIVLIGNITLINTIYHRAPLVARFLAITALLISLLALIFVIQIIRILL